MTIPYPAGGARVEVDGNGVSSTVAVPFAFWLGTDLRVIHTDASGVDTVWAYGPDFTVSGGGGGAGGIAFTPSDLAAGEKLTILLADQGDQAISFSAGQIQSSTIETALDKLGSRLQGVKEQVSRLVGLKESSRSSPPILPDAIAGNYLGWNEAGTDLENKAALSIGTVSQLEEGETPTIALNEDGTFDFGVPTGATGETGSTGSSGTVGTGWTKLLAETDLNGLHLKDVTNLSTYNDIKVVLRAAPELNDGRPRITFSDDGGATFEAIGYHYGIIDGADHVALPPRNDVDAGDAMLI